MKRLVFPVIAILVLWLLVAFSCAEKETVMTQEEGVLEVSSCLNCHSDKNQLKEVAVMSDKVTSDVTSGEG